MNDSDRVAQLERKIDYIFQDKLIGLESLNADHHSVIENGRVYSLRNNKEPAILGDQVIDLVIMTIWYRSHNSQGILAYPTIGENSKDFLGAPLVSKDIDTLRKSLSSNPELAKRASHHGLDDRVMMNPGQLGAPSDKVKATAMESIIANVFLDSGLDLETVRGVMKKLGFFEHPMLANIDCSSLTGH